MIALRMAIAAMLLGSFACGGRTPTRADEPMDAGVDAEPDPPALPTESDKLDVLFVIDNSNTAKFAHAALTGTLPYFIDRLTQPRCVNGLGQIVDTPIMGAECERGQRDFAPVHDIHIGVVSTSLGGHGADTCSPDGTNFDPAQNDGAHLLTRTDAGGEVPSYNGLGFLVWDPDRLRTPPGDSDAASFTTKLQEIVNGVGGSGCGYEAPLEAFYRFLIDPTPYEQLLNDGDKVTPTGVDQRVLSEREAFLRPDSAVLIVMLSDEDDCSIRDGGSYFFAAQSGAGNYHLPRARAVCETAPDDPCCGSCGSVLANCPDDPSCAGGPLDADEDPVNLRCFDQKRRFGIDFLYPIERYTEGLTARSVPNYLGDVLANPLFSGARSPEMVNVVAIAGVPWQDIALSPQSPGAGLMPTHEIPWARLLGEDGKDADDPLMIPSRTARSGTHPVTGEELAPPESTSADANSINGHEHILGEELQYTCIYPLEAAQSCADGSCECNGAATAFNPICQQSDGTYADVQRFGRATPALRQLRLLRELPSRSALGSICTTADFDSTSPAYGYKPTVDAMLRTLRRSLVKP